MEALNSEVERLKEGILTQLQALRWQVVEFSISDPHQQDMEGTQGVVELRLRVSSDVWSEKNEEDKRTKITPQSEGEGEQEVVTVKVDEVDHEAEAQRKKMVDDLECARKLRREWEAAKEVARQEIFDTARKEQNQRMRFADELRESFGLKVRLQTFGLMCACMRSICSFLTWSSCLCSSRG